MRCRWRSAPSGPSLGAGLIFWQFSAGLPQRLSLISSRFSFHSWDIGRASPASCHQGFPVEWESSRLRTFWVHLGEAGRQELKGALLWAQFWLSHWEVLSFRGGGCIWGKERNMAWSHLLRFDETSFRKISWQKSLPWHVWERWLGIPFYVETKLNKVPLQWLPDKGINWLYKVMRLIGHSCRCTRNTFY